MLKLIVFALISGLASSSTVHARTRMRSRALRYIRGQHSIGLRGAAHAALRSRIPEELEEWKDSGASLRSKLSDEHLFELSSAITTEAYGKELHSLVDKESSRSVGLPGNAHTADYLEKQFKNMGLTASRQTVDDERIFQRISVAGADKKVLTNVMGFLKGTDLAHQVILLGAHYDSVNWDNTADNAPGVDDNGSGTALLLQVARALTGAGKKFQPRRSVMFVAFNAEEEGLVGSEHFVEMYKKNGSEKYGDLKAAFIADEVAWPGRGKEQRQAIFETSGHGEGVATMVDTLARLALLKNETSSLRGDGLGDGSHNFVVNYRGFGSDHMSFLTQGIPAVLLIERDNDYHAKQWGHSAKDTFDHVDMSYGAAMTRLALRAIASFANPAS